MLYTICMAIAANPYDTSENAPDCTAHFAACRGLPYGLVDQNQDTDQDQSVETINGLTPHNLTIAERANNLVKQGESFRALKFAEQKGDLYNNPELASSLHAELLHYKHHDVAAIVADAFPELKADKPEPEPEPAPYQPKLGGLIPFKTGIS